MSIFTKFCTGLMVSALSFSVQAADAPQPIDAADTTEVLQSLFIGNEATIRTAIIIPLKNSDNDLASEYAGEAIQEHYGLNKLVKGLSNNKDVSLESDTFSDKLQKIQADKDTEYNTLFQLPNDEFRKVYLQTEIANHQKALELFSQVEAQNADEELKVYMQIFRKMEAGHLAHAQELLEISVAPQDSDSN